MDAPAAVARGATVAVCGDGADNKVVHPTLSKSEATTNDNDRLTSSNSNTNTPTQKKVTPADHYSSSPEHNDTTIAIQRERDVDENADISGVEWSDLFDQIQETVQQISDVTKSFLDNNDDSSLSSDSSDSSSSDDDSDSDDLDNSTAAAVSVYDNFTHPPPPPSENILKTLIQEVTTSNLMTNTRGLTIDSIVDDVKNKNDLSGSNLQLPTDDVISQHIKDILDENEEHIDVSGSLLRPKYTFSYTYRVSNALEELEITASEDTNGDNTNEGSSADKILAKVKSSAAACGSTRFYAALSQGVKDGRYICNNNLYSLRPLNDLSHGEKNEIKETKQNVEKQLSDKADESEEEDCQPAMKKRKKTPKKIAKHDKVWNDKFDKLVAYKTKHGDTKVPREDPSLGIWVATQRTQYGRKNHGLLTEDRLDKLNEIGFVFNLRDTNWNDMFDKLKAYKVDHGDCKVPQDYSQDPSLGLWVMTQRTQYGREKHGNLTADRLLKLEGIGFTFNKLDQQWDDMFDKLKAYKVEHGDTNVPNIYPPNPALGHWVDKQRQVFKRGHWKRKNKMPLDRINRLNEIEFEWVWTSPSMKWFLAVLKDFHKSTSTEEDKRHCHIPYPTTTTSQILKKVWPFVTRLRKRVRQGKELPAWLVEELKKVKFELEPPSRRARRNRVETMILNDLEVNHEIVFNCWDEKIEKSDSRPDAFIVWKYKGKWYIIFKEIDEHRHDDRSIIYEQTRMTMLTVLAMELGFDGIYFVRTNSAERKEIDCKQQAGVAKLLWSIKDEPQDGVHVRYVDFPINHHHYLASVARRIDEDEDEVDLATGAEGEHHMLPLFNSVDEVKTDCSVGV